jgi:diaminopimelate decarboxylase
MSICHPDVSIPTLNEGMVDYKLFTNCSIKEIINIYLEKNDNHNAFFLIDIRQITKLYGLLNEYLPNIKPYYAVKCNPDPNFITILSKLGVNFDCASKKEIELVIDIVRDPSRIIYANPCKQLDYIKYAKEKSVDLMTFDCELELCKIKLYHPNARLLLRIAVDDSGSLVKFSTKFGCKPENIEQLLTTAKREGMNVVGFSFHVGSGCKTPYQYYNAIHECKKAIQIAEKLGIKSSIIDIGGGFPGRDLEYIFYDIVESIQQAIDDFFAGDVEHKTIEFIAEPGRFFAESTHTLVVNIIGKKIIHTNDVNAPIEYMYYINDGVYGSFNCLLFDHAQPVIKTLCEDDDSKTFPSKIFGPTCDSIDVVAENIMLPELHVGDWLYVENFGAYTCAAGSEFNGMERPIKHYIYSTVWNV